MANAAARPLARWAIAGSIVAALAASPSAQGARASVYATVVNDAGEAVRGLGTADFALRDGGVRQAILDAVPATDPLSVAIVADGFAASEAAIVSRAVSEVSDLARRVPGTKIGLMQAGVPLMIDSESPAAGAARMRPAPVMEPLDLAGQIRAACRALAAASDNRRTIVLLLRRRAGDGVVGNLSSVLDLMASTQAAVWVVEAGAAPGGSATAPTALDAFLAGAIQMSGSERQSAATMDALPAATARAVDLLWAQYLVTYTWPDPMLSGFDLETRHDAGHVLVASWR